MLITFENLLLDDRYNIKVADFGMASLQVDGTMLETSCGSPHYACPEVIRGEKYDGKKADVWSCGVILYALLVGALPFDDDNLRHLLEKVKKGVFHVPHFVPPDCQNLLRSMIEVDATKRISLADVFRHPWVNGSGKSDSMERELPMSLIVQTHVIPSEENIDPDVFRHMNSLGCFKDKEKLKRELLNTRHNTEKMVYFLLLDRKRRKPTYEDETEVVFKSTNGFDPPKKRTDTAKPNKYSLGSISDGSPINPRKTYGRLRYNSLNGSPYVSPLQTPRNSSLSARSSFRMAAPNNYLSTSVNGSPKFDRGSPVSPDKGNKIFSAGSSIANNSQSKRTPPVSPLHHSGAWKSRLSSLKNTIMGTPRFHRKKSGGESSDSEDSTALDTSDLVKKSWFGSLTSNSSIDRDEVFCIAVQNKSLNAVKAELIRAFLTVHELSHSIVGHTSFRLDYKRSSISGAANMFSRGVRMSVEIFPNDNDKVEVSNEASTNYVIQFSLISGPTRRFKRLVDHLAALMQSFNQRTVTDRSDKALQMVRPRRLSDTSVSSTCSESETSDQNMAPVAKPDRKDHRHVSSLKIDSNKQQQRGIIVANRWATSHDQSALLKSPVPVRRNFLTSSPVITGNAANAKTSLATRQASSKATSVTIESGSGGPLMSSTPAKQSQGYQPAQLRANADYHRNLARPEPVLSPISPV